MKIVIAPDSFKGSLAAKKVAKIMKEAILDVYPKAVILEKPMADGGEGTIDAFLSSFSGERVQMNCKGPLGETISTEYAIIEENTAIIECAKVIGLPQVPLDKRNPDFTTSYGLGGVIQDALDKECESIIIGLGGSATNDGGLGMLQSLGMKAYDKDGKEIGPYGKDLLSLSKVDLSALDARLKHLDIKIASDVDNPLIGKKGASAVYGPQKGASQRQVKQYDDALKNFSKEIEKKTNKKSIHLHEGAGAAGGLGFAMLVLGGEIISGAKLIADRLSLEEEIQKADAVFTGEGKSDYQTLHGKAPGYVASLGKKYDVPVFLISGGLQDIEQLDTLFSGSFSIVPKPISLKESIKQTEKFLYEQTRQVFKSFTYGWRR